MQGSNLRPLPCENDFLNLLSFNSTTYRALAPRDRDTDGQKFTVFDCLSSQLCHAVVATRVND